MTIPEPLPCPFCGEAGVSLTVDSDTESVTCDGCTATGPSMLKVEHTSEEAMCKAVIDAWNQRDNPPEVCRHCERPRAQHVFEPERAMFMGGVIPKCRGALTGYAPKVSGTESKKKARR